MNMNILIFTKLPPIAKKDIFDIFIYFRMIKSLLDKRLNYFPAFSCMRKF